MKLVLKEPGQRNTGEKLQDIAKEEIFKSIGSFYFDIYDDESYLIWVKDPGKSEFFHILRCMRLWRLNKLYLRTSCLESRQIV